MEVAFDAVGSDVAATDAAVAGSVRGALAVRGELAMIAAAGSDVAATDAAMVGSVIAAVGLDGCGSRTWLWLPDELISCKSDVVLQTTLQLPELKREQRQSIDDFNVRLL